MALLLCLQACTRAQLPSYHVRMLTSQQGLNTSEVQSMATDKKGFLWLVSQNLVQRYDGRMAKRFEFNETANEMYIDAHDRKWVLGRTGVFLYKNDLDGFVNAGTGEENKKTPVCMFETNGILYLLLTGGLCIYDEKMQQFVKQSAPYFFFSKKLQGRYSKFGSHLFLSTGDSLHRVNIQSGQVSTVPFRSLFFMLATGNDELVVSNWDAQTFIVNFSTGKSSQVLPADIKGPAATKLVRFFGGGLINNDRFLFATYNGMVEYNSSRKTFGRTVLYHSGRPLMSNNNSRYFFRDNNGNVYITYPDGICFFNSTENPMRYIREYSWNGISMPDIDVRCFAESNNGKIWFATVTGIAALDIRTGVLNTFTPVQENGSSNFPSIRYLLFAGSKLWTGTGGKGVWLMDTTTKKFNRPLFEKDSTGLATADRLNNEFIWKLEPLRNGDVFVCGENHCYLINSRTFRARQVDMAPGSGGSRSAIQDSEGRIWHGTSTGLYCYNEQFRLLFSIRDSFPDKRIASLCELTPGRILIGSKGLFEVTIKNNAVFSCKQLAVLPANKLYYCMQKDAAGNVWLGANDGLLCYKPAENKSIFLDAADNVQPQAFNSNGLFLSRDNLVFAGGKAGFNYFDPSGIQSTMRPLLPVVVSLSAGNDDTAFFKQAPPYSTGYSSSSFVISISVPEFIRPYSLQYRYRLNHNSEWIPNGNSSTVRITNLPPGHYNFQPSVSYDGNLWFDGAVSTGLRVLKPWWQQWWFRGLVMGALAALLWLYRAYKQRQRIAQNHQQTIDYFANSGHEHGSTDDILWDITRNCISRLGFEDCVIYMLDEERQLLVQRAAYGTKSPKKFEIINPIEIPLGKGITGCVAEKGIAEIVNDTSKDSRYLVDDEVRLSELVVPIIHNEKIIGIIDSENRKKNFFTKKHLETLQTIASICAAKISVTMAVERMQMAIRQAEEVNNKMTETKFINLRLQMNPHFLFNSLNSIQHLIVSQQANEAYKYLSVFSGFLRSVLQYADKTFITLDDELKMLNMYIRLESLGFDSTFKYEVTVDDSLDTEDILIPPLMVQPLIENAIWHGLLHKEGEKYFSVSFINNHDDNLVCIVQDNGIGRREAAAIKENSLSNFAYNGKATMLIRERLLLLKQKTGKEASMFVEDVKPEGTRVKLIIPYYNNDEA